MLECVESVVVNSAHFNLGGLNMKCVAYMRVSTEKQAEEGNGLDSQKRDILKYAGNNQLVISEWYVDDGYTGSNMDRPALQRLIKECMNKKIDKIVSFKLDRLSRNMIDGLYIIEKIFMPNGVEFKCVHDNVNYDDPMQQAYTQMMAVFAQLDKNTMMLRMRGGMLERVKKGYWMGGGNTPYCYRYDKNTGILEPIPERVEKVNRALDLFIQGYSDERIYRLLGFKSETIVRKNLTSVVNIGMIPYKGNVYQGLHKPVFDKSKFELGLKLRNQRRNAKIISPHKTSILTGLCYCGECGCKMRYQKWYTGEYKIYCCSRNSALDYLPNWNPDCKNTLEWAKDIETQVVDEIKKISLNIDQNNNDLKIEKEADVIQKEIQTKKTKLKRLYEAYAGGSETLSELIQEMEEDLKTLELKLSELKENTENKEAKKETARQIKKIADVWERLDTPSKNKVLKSIIERINISNGDIEIVIKNY